MTAAKPVDKMTVADLKAELKSRGLPEKARTQTWGQLPKAGQGTGSPVTIVSTPCTSQGLKAELAERLQKARDEDPPAAETEVTGADGADADPAEDGEQAADQAQPATEEPADATAELAEQHDDATAANGGPVDHEVAKVKLEILNAYRHLIFSSA